MTKNQCIIYINYSPYENSGKILDYLLENFENVFLFSIGFYNIKTRQQLNKLLIFKNGELKREFRLFQIPTSKLVFLLLPIKSIITFIQILIHSYWLKKDHKKIDFYFTVNGFTAWIGIILGKLKIVNKTVFWVWDYYPPIHKSKTIMLIRWAYWQFDKISTQSDRVVYVNRRLMDLRKDIGILSEKTEYPIVPIGTDLFNVVIKEKRPPVIIGFIGVLKKGQGLDVVFDNAKSLVRSFPNAKFEVVGSGPDENYFRQRAKKSPLETTFYGYLEGESFNEILKKCSIGVATYIPDPSNVSYYGDPGKVKRYLSLGLPVIITDIFEFSKEIEAYKAGVIIKYGNSNEFTDAIQKIMSSYKLYQKNALKLAEKYYYKKIYPEIFNLQ